MSDEINDTNVGRPDLGVLRDFDQSTGINGEVGVTCSMIPLVDGNANSISSQLMNRGIYISCEHKQSLKRLLTQHGLRSVPPVVLVAIISRKQVAIRFADSNRAVVVRQCCVNMAVVDQHVVRGVVEHLLSVGCHNEGIG
jgi:hypothetical protein